MSNSKRPNHARVVTKATEKKRKSELDRGIAMTIDDDRFEVRLGDLTPAIARELRAHVGHGFQWLAVSLGEDPDLDLVAAFVWLARRVRGEDVELEDVEVTYAQLLSDGFEIDSAVDAEEVDELGPEG